jgi:hypothetical protein
VSRRASWIRIEPTPPAPPVIKSVRGSTLLPGRAPRRSSSNSQAMIEVSGKAAACANDSNFGFLPTMRSSTRWNSELVPWRRIEPA